MRWGWGVLLLGVVSFSHADRVKLANGQVIDGIISKEDASGVVLDIGGGTATFRPSQITSVEHSTVEERDAIIREWRTRYFLHPRYVPQGLEPVAKAYRELSAKRADSVKAHRQLNGSDDRAV